MIVRYRLDAPLVALRGCVGRLMADGRAWIAGGPRRVSTTHLERVSYVAWANGQCGGSFTSWDKAAKALCDYAPGLEVGPESVDGWTGALDGVRYEIRLTV